MGRNRVVITSVKLPDEPEQILGIWGPLTPKEASAWRKYKMRKWNATIKRIQKPQWSAMRKAKREYGR